MGTNKFANAVKKNIYNEDCWLTGIQWAMFILYCTGLIIALIGMANMSTLWQGHYIAIMGFTLSIVGITIFPVPFKRYIISSACSFLCGIIFTVLVLL